MPDVLQSLKSEAERPGSTTVIDCAAYCGGVRVADVGIGQIRGALEESDKFVWLGLYEPEKDILRAVQQLFPTLGVARENFVVVSGIGCSSRFPYYMNVYGFHTIHGRAPTIATGLKATRLIVIGVGKVAELKPKDFVRLGGFAMGRVPGAAAEASKSGDHAILYAALIQQAYQRIDEGGPADALGLCDAAEALAARGVPHPEKVHMARGGALTRLGRIQTLSDPFLNENFETRTQFLADGRVKSVAARQVTDKAAEALHGRYADFRAAATAFTTRSHSLTSTPSCLRPTFVNW